MRGLRKSWRRTSCSCHQRRARQFIRARAQRGYVTFFLTDHDMHQAGPRGGGQERQWCPDVAYNRPYIVCLVRGSTVRSLLSAAECRVVPRQPMLCNRRQLRWLLASFFALQAAYHAFAPKVNKVSSSNRTPGAATPVVTKGRSRCCSTFGTVHRVLQIGISVRAALPTVRARAGVSSAGTHRLARAKCWSVVHMNIPDVPTVDGDPLPANAGKPVGCDSGGV